LYPELNGGRERSSRDAVETTTGQGSEFRHLDAPTEQLFCALASASRLWTMADLFAYVVSFVYLGIYWVNHHHLLQAAERVNGAILWANLHLLFWLSLVPFATEWIGEHYEDTVPTALYGIVLLGAGCAYMWLVPNQRIEKILKSG
jgi:uncharacterized membrane protein